MVEDVGDGIVIAPLALRRRRIISERRERAELAPGSLEGCASLVDLVAQACRRLVQGSGADAHGVCNRLGTNSPHHRAEAERERPAREPEQPLYCKFVRCCHTCISGAELRGVSQGGEAYVA